MQALKKKKLYIKKEKLPGKLRNFSHQKLLIILIDSGRVDIKFATVDAQAAFLCLRETLVEK